MARPKEFDQEVALRKAIGLFSQQGFAATSTDELMRVMDVGRQSMYDTFGDKRALFLSALELYVTESVQSIGVELDRNGSALSAVRNALVTFAERKDLSSSEGCMGLNAIGEFGQRDADVTRITRSAARIQRQNLMKVFARAKLRAKLTLMRTWRAWQIFLRVRLRESGSRPKPVRVGRHFGRSQPLREERSWDRIAEDWRQLGREYPKSLPVVQKKHSFWGVPIRDERS